MPPNMNPCGDGGIVHKMAELMAELYLAELL